MKGAKVIDYSNFCPFMALYFTLFIIQGNTFD